MGLLDPCLLPTILPLAINSSRADDNAGCCPLEECLFLCGGQISSLLRRNDVLRGRGIFFVPTPRRIDASRFLMPITIIVIRRPIQQLGGAIAVPVRDYRTTTPDATVRFDRVAPHGGGEARVAHVCGRGMAQQAIRGDHWPAAQVPVKVLTEYAGHAVERHRIRTRVQEAKAAAGGGIAEEGDGLRTY